jgi:hypothetical protein
MNEQRKLIRNAAKCKHCGDVIESVHRHHFVMCSCEKISVDGGLEYTSYSFPDMPIENHIEILAEYEAQ